MPIYFPQYMPGTKFVVDEAKLKEALEAANLEDEDSKIDRMSKTKFFEFLSFLQESKTQQEITNHARSQLKLFEDESDSDSEEESMSRRDIERWFISSLVEEKIIRVVRALRDCHY